MAPCASDLLSQPDLARALIESLPCGALVLDGTGRVLDANPAARTLFESLSDPLDGLHVGDLFEEESPAGTPIGLPVLADGEGVETNAVGRGGSGVFLSASLRWRRVEIDDDVRILVAIHDTGPARQAAAALRTGQALFRDHVEKNPGAVVMHGLDGRISYVNDAACQAIGRSLGELVGHLVTDVVVPEDVPALTAHLASLANRVPVEGVTRIVTGDGSIRSMMCRSFVVDDAGGGEPYVICHGVDVTERMQIEFALQESEKRLRSALDAAELGIWEWDLGTGQIAWGGHHATMFGLALDEFDGRFETFAACVHADDRPAVEQRIADARNAHSVYDHEYRVVWPDGSVHWVHGRGVFVYDTDGHAIKMLGAVTEVTQRHELEQQLLQAQKLESIGQLAAGIAHEINTPTQYVGDNARFLQTAFRDLWQVIGAYQNLGETARADGTVAPKMLDDLDTLATEVDLEFLVGEIPRAIEQSLEGVERVATIVAAMKDFSHPSSDEKKPLDLNRALVSTATVARNEWKYVAELETDLDSALPPVSCHAGLLNQVFLNLIVNAAHAIDSVHKSTGALGKITLATRTTSGGVEVRISDTGTGIPAEIRDRVFLPFFTTKGVGKGTGQGLSMARATVVDRHGGTLHFEDAPGGGTTFVIGLPMATPDAQPEAGK